MTYFMFVRVEMTILGYMEYEMNSNVRFEDDHDILSDV